jgi:hypothetical protein
MLQAYGTEWSDRMLSYLLGALAGPLKQTAIVQPKAGLCVAKRSEEFSLAMLAHLPVQNTSRTDACLVRRANVFTTPFLATPWTCDPKMPLGPGAETISVSANSHRS